MSSRSQRRKERHARKRQEKKKKQQRASQRRPFADLRRPSVSVVSQARHRERLAQQIPHPWEGELPVDVAVLDDAVLSVLPPELAQQVSIVRSSLQAALESRGEEALSEAAVIPRGSPLSEWRLFIRGLVAWLADDFTGASEIWQRMDRERRPGRIAEAMALALRSDLESLPRAGTQAQPAGSEPALTEIPEDPQLIFHARLLRRVRIDRPALSVAEAGLKIPDETPELLIGPRKVEWLLQFINEYRDTEPELTAALSLAALGRASAQPFVDLFDLIARRFSGPPHDRRNRLLAYFYYRRFGDDRAEPLAERALNDYLKQDLPKNKELPDSLRSAIISQIHLVQAMLLLQSDDSNTLMTFIYGNREDTAGIRRHLKAAVKAAPGNQQAHKFYADWLQDKMDDDNLTQRQRGPLESELASVMQCWSDGLPGDTEPRLWLVNHLLENEQLDDARPHVDFLAASRQDDPMVRAAPWKWMLLDAMRLCRRKAWLAGVSSRLDEAESLWPAWLPKQWLPYLRAAFALRCGETGSYERQREQICEASGLVRDSLADACLMLGAAQQMRVPAEGLKSLRAVLDQVLKQIASLPTDDLIQAGCFFWDLHRVQLRYPAYRLHAAKIGREFIGRLLQPEGQSVGIVSDERFQKAVLWASEYRFWSNSNQTRLLPLFATSEAQQDPMLAAARLNAFLRQRYHWGGGKYRTLGSMLRKAAPSWRDAYYRHWFIALADELDEAIQNESRSTFGRLFDSRFTGFDDDDDDDDLDSDPDETDVDEFCDCEVCRAARNASEYPESSDRPVPF